MITRAPEHRGLSERLGQFDGADIGIEDNIEAGAGIRVGSEAKLLLGGWRGGA